jgi:hypothetical protein
VGHHAAAALGYILMIATATLALDWMGVPRDWRSACRCWWLNVVLTGCCWRGGDRGKLVSPASAPRCAGAGAPPRALHRGTVHRDGLPHARTLATAAAGATDVTEEVR